MAYDFTKMRNILSDWNLELTAEKEQQFLTFYEMLVDIFQTVFLFAR